jgi:hypothetical protein
MIDLSKTTFLTDAEIKEQAPAVFTTHLQVRFQNTTHTFQLQK